MTLYQMSWVYREDAARFRTRIAALREQAGRRASMAAARVRRQSRFIMVGVFIFLSVSCGVGAASEAFAEEADGGADVVL